MNRVECKTQKELDTALEGGHIPILVGTGHFVLRGTSCAELHESSRAELHESSRATLFGSSRATLFGSSRAELHGSSRAELFESSCAELHESSRAELHESSRAELFESSCAEGSKFTAIHVHSPSATATGGVVIFVEVPRTPAEWCDYYGAKQDGETAILFKAVGDDYASPHGTIYAPGTMPEAKDWDGGERECGGGLHFCAHPAAALTYSPGATKFVACPVRLADIAVHKNPLHPNKVKARRVCAPTYEVDRHGKPLKAEMEAGA